MSHVPAAPEPAHVSRVPRTLLDRVAQWWRTSTLTLWAVAGAAGLFQLMVLNVASYTYPHLPMRGWVIVTLLLAGSLLGRRRWPLAVVTATSLASAAADLWGPFGGLFLLSMLALYALLVAAPTRDRLIGFSICTLCDLIPAALAKWPQEGALSPEIVTLVFVLAVASISRSRREALEHGDAQLAAQSAEQRLVAQRDAARHQARVAAELHDSVGHGLTTIIALSEGLAGGADPEIDEALGGINEVARECLEQTRRAVRALADAEDEPADSLDWDGAGRRTWDEIRSVVGRVRSLGVTVIFTETGQRADDAGQAELCFALTREALTNAVRHAPALSQVQVSWDHGESAVTVTVRNDGSSGGRGGEDDGRRGGPAEGTGLLRLQDRVEAVGGSLDWGPESDGGWLVTATVPRTRGEG